MVWLYLFGIKTSQCTSNRLHVLIPDTSNGNLDIDALTKLNKWMLYKTCFEISTLVDSHYPQKIDLELSVHEITCNFITHKHNACKSMFINYLIRLLHANNDSKTLISDIFTHSKCKFDNFLGSKQYFKIVQEFVKCCTEQEDVYASLPCLLCAYCMTFANYFWNGYSTQHNVIDFMTRLRNICIVVGYGAIFISNEHKLSENNMKDLEVEYFDILKVFDFDFENYVRLYSCAHFARGIDSLLKSLVKNANATGIALQTHNMMIDVSIDMFCSHTSRLKDKHAGIMTFRNRYNYLGAFYSSLVVACEDLCGLGITSLVPNIKIHLYGKYSIKDLSALYVILGEEEQDHPECYAFDIFLFKLTEAWICVLQKCIFTVANTKVPNAYQNERNNNILDHRSNLVKIATYNLQQKSSTFSARSIIYSINTAGSNLSMVFILPKYMYQAYGPMEDALHFAIKSCPLSDDEFLCLTIYIAPILSVIFQNVYLVDLQSPQYATITDLIDIVKELTKVKKQRITWQSISCIFEMNKSEWEVFSYECANLSAVILGSAGGNKLLRLFIIKSYINLARYVKQDCQFDTQTAKTRSNAIWNKSILACSMDESWTGLLLFTDDDKKGVAERSMKKRQIFANRTLH